MFIEVVGHSLPDDVDRDDVEDLLTEALGPDGEVTGAGTGSGRWNLDVEISAGDEQCPHVVERLAAVLVAHDLGWVTLRPEHEKAGTAARLLQPLFAGAEDVFVVHWLVRYAVDDVYRLGLDTET